MILLDREQLQNQQPQFVWSNPGYYQITRDGLAVYFHLSKFPKKIAITLPAFGLVGFIVGLAILLREELHPPWYAVAVPLAIIVLALLVRLYVVRRQFGFAQIRVVSNTCLVKSRVGDFEVHPLRSVLLQIRAKTRDGHKIGEMGERELFLVTENPEARRLFFPLARQGTVDKLGIDLAAAAQVSLEKEYVK